MDLAEHIELVVVAFLALVSAVGGLWAYIKNRRTKADEDRPTMRPPPPAALLVLALVLQGCGLFGQHEPTVRALTPVLTQVAEHVANKGLELAQLPAQCEWEQDVDDPDKLLVLCEVDTGKR